VEPVYPPVPAPPIPSAAGATTDLTGVTQLIPAHILARWPDAFSFIEGAKTYYVSPNSLTVQASLVHGGIQAALDTLTARFRTSFYDIRDTRTVVRFMSVEFRGVNNRPGFDAAWLYRRDGTYDGFCLDFPRNCPDGHAWVAGVTDVHDGSGISTLYVAWDSTNLPLVKAIIQHEALHLIWYLSRPGVRCADGRSQWLQIDHGGSCDPLVIK
jgi:hypothetical protein